MNRCEHGQKITKFCITDHCHNKEAGGCEYCIKKYHFHLTNTTLISESDIEELIKNVTIRPDIKYKSRNYQETATDFFKNFKASINSWIDNVISGVSDKLSYPVLKKYGFLPTYNKLKNREFKKLNGKEIKAIYEFSKSKKMDDLQKEEENLYFQSVEEIQKLIFTANKVLQNITKQFEKTQYKLIPNENNSIAKIKEIYENIEKQKIKRKDYLERAIMLQNNGGGQKNMFKNIQQVTSNIILKDDRKEKIQKEQQGPHKLRKRASSIDYHLKDFKFGVGYDEKNKEIEQRYKKLINLTSQTNDKESDTKSEVKESQEKKSKQEEKPSQNNIFSELLSQGLNLGDLIINNILPPLPPSSNKYEPPQKIESKTVKVPVTVNTKLRGTAQDEEVQSPILKRKKTLSQALHIELKRVQPSKQTTPAKEKEENAANLKVIKEEKLEESTTPIKQMPVEPLKIKQDEESEPILLESNQKNSLLLFSEALKAPADRAITLLQASLKYSPNNLSAAEYLSFLYLQTNRPKQCLSVCDSMLSQIQDRPQEFQLTLHLHNNKAAALNLLGRYSESIVILQKCLKSRRKDYFYKNLADAYFNLGILEKAALNYEKAIKLNDQYDETYYNLAVCLFIQNQFASCELNIQNALKICPDNETYKELYTQVQKRISIR